MHFTPVIMFSCQAKESFLKESFTNFNLDASSENLTKGHGHLVVPSTLVVYKDYFVTYKRATYL